MKGRKHMKTTMRTNLKAILAVLCTACLSVLAKPSLVNASTTYDFNTDFSATSNPSGAWSYGWSTSRGSAFNLDQVEVVIAGGLDQWRPFSQIELPAIAHNGTNMTITPACCDPIPPGATNLHPGPSGENCVARWTAPASGAYQVSAVFSGGDQAGTTTDVSVLKNSSTSLYVAEVTGFGPPSAQSYSGTVTVAVGDTIDFTVGFGTDGTYYSDGTYFTATITVAYSAQVQQPINLDGSSVFSVKRGVVPVKFTLTSGGLATCQLPPATISLMRNTGGTPGPIDESTYLLPSDSGSNFRADTTNCQYVYNLATSSLGPGMYTVNILIGGNIVGNATFALK